MTFSALSFFVSAFAWAEDVVVPAGSGNPATAAPPPSVASSMVPMIAIFAIFYFLMIRPQQKKLANEQKRKQEMFEALKQGDEILTNSGILGKVTGIADKVITVEVANDVKIKMLKSQVSQVIKQGQIKELA